MNQEAAQKGPGVPILRALHPVSKILVRWWPLLLSIFGLAVALTLSAPTWLWWYHSELAGHFMGAGLEWSQNRQVDDLPQLRNELALRSGIAHLNTAIYWRPKSAFTYRMLGESYAAQHDWPHAVQAFEHARTLAPTNPLAEWEAGLVYEQMWYALVNAPTDELVGTFAQAHVEVPTGVSRETICGTLATNCPIGQTAVTQPYAGFREASNKAHFLLVAAQARVAYSLLIPPERPVLRFLLGRDPFSGVRSPVTTTYHIWLETAGGTPKEVYTRQLAASTIKGGWVGDTADLHSWAGHVVTLTLGITLEASAPLPQLGYGWGDIALTTQEAALFAASAPEAHTRAAWSSAGLTAASMMSVADNELEAAHPAIASEWYDRAKAGGVKQTGSIAFRSAIAAVASGQRFPSDLDPLLLSTHLLTEDVYIQARTLQWMIMEPSWHVNYGDPLAKFPGSDPEMGVLHWDGSAVTAVEVLAAGTYHITIRGQHLSPAPIQFRLEHNLRPVMSFAFVDGDKSWQEVGTDVYFEPGLHVIGIRFMNDGVINGVDRDLVLDWIRFERQ